MVSTHHRYIIRISYAQIFITVSYHEKIHIILLSILISQSREVESRGKGLDIREEYYFYFVLYIVYNVKIFSTNRHCFYKLVTTKIPPKNIKTKRAYLVPLYTESLGGPPHQVCICYQWCSVTSPFEFQSTPLYSS